MNLFDNLRNEQENLTLFDKLWQAHEIEVLLDGRSMLFVDRHIIHDVSSPQAFSDLADRKLPVFYPELTFATADHIVSTEINRNDETIQGGKEMIQALRSATKAHGIQFIDVNDPDQGIIHICFSEQGVILPGNSVCCGDSHTCTLGAFGALAFAVGTSEITQILASQTVFRDKPKNMRIYLAGEFQKYTYAKDLVLHIINEIGANGARGFAIEFTGPLAESLSMEERFTLCNMAAEMGAATALFAPDDKTFAYLENKSHAPHGKKLQESIVNWRKLESDMNAVFDLSYEFNVDNLTPQITWGTSPDQGITIADNVPVSDIQTDKASRKYMDVEEEQSLIGLPIDTVFIGSCTNARISDLRIAAAVIGGAKVANNVRGIVVPGSSQIRKQAEDEGLDVFFKKAGFEWRKSGCSMCAALNSDRMDANKRCISTSNRNYEGRQGVGSRTHLASPATAAACAIAGKIVDVSEV